MSTKIKKEISIPYLHKIVQEELENYVGVKLTEENVREMIINQLDKSGKSIVFNNLGLEKDTWNNSWKLKSYGKFEDILRKHEKLIMGIGSDAISELIKEITPENVLESLTQKDKNLLKKIYRETLLNSFEKQVKRLAEEHGELYAEKLFEQYLKDNEETKE